MSKKFASSVLVTVLILTLGGTSAFAGNRSDLDAVISASLADSSQAKTQPESGQKLRKAMDHLVAEARAGRLNRAERPQIQPAQSNSLSKKTKIAIGVGIAVAVIAIIVIHQRNHALDSLGGIRAF